MEYSKSSAQSLPQLQVTPYVHSTPNLAVVIYTHRDSVVMGRRANLQSGLRVLGTGNNPEPLSPQDSCKPANTDMSNHQDG